MFAEILEGTSKPGSAPGDRRGRGDPGAATVALAAAGTPKGRGREGAEGGDCGGGEECKGRVPFKGCFFLRQSLQKEHGPKQETVP